MCQSRFHFNKLFSSSDGKCVPGVSTLLFPIPGQHSRGRVWHGGGLPARAARHVTGKHTQLVVMVCIELNDANGTVPVVRLDWWVAAHHQPRSVSVFGVIV